MATLQPENTGTGTMADSTGISTYDQDAEDKEKQLGQTQEEAAPELGGPASTDVGTMAAPKSPQTSVPTAGRQGSGMGQRLSNLRKFVERNVGGAQQMTSKITDDIRKREEATQKALTAQRQAAEDQAATEQARLTSGEGLISPEGQNILAQGQTSQFVEQATPEQLEAFTKFRTGQASPIELAQEQELSKQVQDIGRRTQALGTEEGRFQTLRERFARPEYSTGQQRLDQLLLQADPTAAKSLASLRGTEKDEADRLQAIRDLAVTRSGEIADRAGTLSGNIQRQLGQAQTGLGQTIEERFAQAQAANQAAREGLGTEKVQENLIQQLLSGSSELLPSIVKQDSDLSRRLKELKLADPRREEEDLYQDVIDIAQKDPEYAKSLGIDLDRLTDQSVMRDTRERRFIDDYYINKPEAIEKLFGGEMIRNLTPEQRDAILGTIPQQVQSPEQIALSSVASAQDLARAQALAKLSGQTGQQIIPEAARVGEYQAFDTQAEKDRLFNLLRQRLTGQA